MMQCSKGEMNSYDILCNKSLTKWFQFLEYDTVMNFNN